MKIGKGIAIASIWIAFGISGLTGPSAVTVAAFALIATGIIACIDF